MQAGSGMGSPDSHGTWLRLPARWTGWQILAVIMISVVLFLTVPGAPNFDDRWESGIIEGKGGRLVTTIHVRYEILDDPGRPHPDSASDSFAWGVQAVGLPGNLSAFGVGDILDEALGDLAEGIRALFSAASVPDELTREIAVTVGDAA